MDLTMGRKQFNKMLKRITVNQTTMQSSNGSRDNLFQAGTENGQSELGEVAFMKDGTRGSRYAALRKSMPNYHYKESQRARVFLKHSKNNKIIIRAPQLMNDNNFSEPKNEIHESHEAVAPCQISQFLKQFEGSNPAQIGLTARQTELTKLGQELRSFRDSKEGVKS